MCVAHLLHKFSPFSPSTKFSLYLLTDLFAFDGVMVAALEVPQSGAHVFLRCDSSCTGIVLPHPIDLVGVPLLTE